jgi:RimJ/RimL family protein N-acetyltransferase
MLLFRDLRLADAASLVACLKRQRLDYIGGYQPFLFEVECVENLVSSARLDQYIGVFYQATAASCIIIGLLTLRGLDEGYNDPMLGIFIAEEYGGRGYARQALDHAEKFSQSRGHSGLLLKCSIHNARALKLYLKQGYQELRQCDARTILMVKSF